MNGWEKNWEVLKHEWRDTLENWTLDCARLKNGNWKLGDRRHFIPHVLVAFVSDFFGLRRTLTYLTLIGVPIGFVYWLL